MRHRTSAYQVPYYDDIDGWSWRYQALCPCGWISEPQPDRAAARRTGTAHAQPPADTTQLSLFDDQDQEALNNA